MDDITSRKFERIRTLNLVAYVHYDKNGNPDYEGAGRTMDLSENGILLDTGIEFETKTVMELEIAIQEEILKPKGIIMRTEKDKDSIKLGIQFIEIKPEETEIIKRFIRDAS